MYTCKKTLNIMVSNEQNFLQVSIQGFAGAFRPENRRILYNSLSQIS